MLQRQKAAKKNGPQLLDDEDDFLDEASDPTPLLHPPADPTQLPASQYPAGVALPGQDPLSANRIAAFQAGVQQRTQDTPKMQGQAAAAQAKRWKAAPQQAAAQEVTQPAVAADAGPKQGRKRGGKKQAQKVGWNNLAMKSAARYCCMVSASSAAFGGAACTPILNLS